MRDTLYLIDKFVLSGVKAIKRINTLRNERQTHDTCKHRDHCINRKLIWHLVGRLFTVLYFLAFLFDH